MKAKLRFGFLMDPIDKILPDKDTTFVFMLESQKRGHEVLYFTPCDLHVKNGEPFAVVRNAEVRRGEPHYRLGETKRLQLKELDALFMRVDPPFTLDYLTQTYFLDLIKDEVFVTNDPGAIRDANEKLFTLNFPEVIPPTLITHEIEMLKQFLQEAGGEIVIKPLFASGGRGVFVLKIGDRNLNALLETATDGGTRRVIAQKYIPEVRNGDKRIILLNGEAIGATARVPRDDEHRANIHVGGRCVKYTLNERDKEIVARVGPELRKRGLHFVGLDVLGDWLTEINVTSPTGIQEIDKLDNTCLEALVIDFVENQIK